LQAHNSRFAPFSPPQWIEIEVVCLLLEEVQVFRAPSNRKGDSPGAILRPWAHPPGVWFIMKKALGVNRVPV